MKAIFHILLVFSLSIVAYSQNNIIAAEYYIDSDPGKGKGTSITANDGSFDSTSEAISLNLSTSSLSFGRHYIFIRYKDANNGWGESKAVALDIANPRGLDDYVMTTEYFIDSDPGEGKGISVDASDGSFNSTEESFSGSINTTNLTHGSHKIFVRAKGSRGGWGDATSVVLAVVDTVAPTISSVSIKSDNSAIDVTFNELVYNTVNGSGDLEVSDFKFQLSSGRAQLRFENPTSISFKDGVYTLGIGLAGIPEASQKITVNPVDDSIYDIVGNEISQTQTNNNAAFFGPNKYVIKIDGTGDYSEIQSAIENSNTKHGDTLLVYPGLYQESVDYKQKNIVLGSQYITTDDTSYRDKTVIQGSVAMDSLNSDAALIGFMIYKNGVSIKSSSPVLKRLHIRENQSTEALHISANSNLTINDIEIKKTNQSGGNGGGIQISNSRLVLNNAVIDSNITNNNSGGGIWSFRSFITINQSQINDNQGHYGGAIYSKQDSSFTMNNVSVLRDSSNNSGGGIYFEESLTPVTISNSIFDDNRSRNYGSGIKSDRSSIVIDNSTFQNNRGYDGNGGTAINFVGTSNKRDSLIVTNSKFYKNISKSGSGAIRIEQPNDGYVNFTNVLIIRNETIVGSASGLIVFDSNGNTDVFINNCTVTQNIGGQAVYRVSGGSTNKKIINSIVWGNSSSTAHVGGFDVSYSNIEDGYAGTGNINSDPNFVDLENDDYRLSDSSPSIGSGTKIGAPITDIEGNPRPNPAGSNPDMGAHESSRSTRVTGTYYIMKTGNDLSSGSLASPFLTVQRGIDRAYHGDTVIVYTGKYIEDIDYKEKNIVLASRYLTTNDITYRDNTVIQGKVSMESLDSRAALIGFMIYKNRIKIDYGSPVLKRIHIREYNGRGALTLISTNVTIDHIEVKNNHLQVDEATGGALTILASKVILNNAVIDSNINNYGIGNQNGGGIYSEHSFVTINDSQINDNAAINGGGIFSYDSKLNIIDSKVMNNSSDRSGGGITSQNDSLFIIDNSYIDNNSSINGGGGIHIDASADHSSLFHITNSSIAKNTTYDSGGAGIYYYSGNIDTLLIENTSIVSNTLTGISQIGGGGGIYFNGLRGTFSNVLFAKNKAQKGSAMWAPAHDQAIMRVTNSTFVSNEGYNAIAVANSYVREFINTIAWHNINTSGHNVTGGSVSVIYSNFEKAPLVQGIPFGGMGNLDLDPQFVDLANSDYSLQPTSPSIDTGHPDLDGDGETWESDLDDQDPDGTRMDMGSSTFNQYENEPPTIEITNIDENTKFGSGSNQTIEWNATDNFRINWTKLFLKAPDSTRFTLIDSVYGNPGTYAYQVPLKISRDYYIKISVSDPSNNTAADIKRFEVIDVTPPVISLLKPNPNFKILEYDTLDIEWSLTDNHLLDSTWIYYSLDNLANLILIDSMKSDVMKYEYKIPTGVTKQAKIKIVSKDSTGNTGNVESTLIEVIDNTKPTIAWSELDNKIFKIGNSVELKWTSSDNVGVDKIDLSYSKNQSEWIEVARQITNQNKYNWEIVNDPYNSVSLRVIGYDAVQFSDTSIMNGYTIKESYPQITTTDVTNTFDWKTKEIKLVFDQPLDANSITNTNFTFSSQQNDTQTPSFNYDNNTKSITLTFKDGFISKDSIGIIVSGGIKSSYGYLFDGDRNNAPGGEYVLNFKTSLIGDYNFDSLIDVLDLAVLINSLENKNVLNELGPVEGSAAPHFRTIEDGKIDIEDVMAFVRIWNWQKQNSSSLGKVFVTNQKTTDIEFYHDHLTIPLTDEISFYEVEVKFLKGDFEIQPNALPDALLKYYDSQQNILYLASQAGQKEIDIPYKFSDRLGSVSVSYRLINRNSEPVFQGQLEKIIENIPNQFALHENYPNPFNPLTTLRFDIPLKMDVRITIFNMLGQSVKTFNLKDHPSGYHSIIWNATNDYGDPVGAGVYFYQLQAEDFVKTRKMILLK